MAAVRRETKRRVLVRSPKSVLLLESLDTSSESSSLASSIAECTSFRNTATKSKASPTNTTLAQACFEQVDKYTWFVSIDRPSDLLVEVDDVSFHLHKLPLLSRSGLLFRLAGQSCDARKAYINLVEVPGGAEAFVLVAKLCYGVEGEVTATSVAAVRCCAEYLEMTEAFEEGNVVSRADAFLDRESWQESIIVLQSCELLLPWAEDMRLVTRCAQAVARQACTTDATTGCDWWYADVSHLTIYCFRELVDAVAASGSMSAALLGGALEYYAQRWVPGLGTGITATSSPHQKQDATLYLTNAPSELDSSVAEQTRSRVILEEIVAMLPPPHKDAVSCSFLLRATRAAYMLNCDAACKADLERRAGRHLAHATLTDLLIPCFSHTSEYLYDVDIVRRILDHFLIQEQSDASAGSSPRWCSGGVYDGSKAQPALSVRARVAKLLDSYLAEVARDSKLPLAKFLALAEALPEGARLCDDGLYRAVDTYLKIHASLSEHERKRLCRILNCHRLSLEACTHASQNERLPLRFVVQVLFCEQVKIRSTVTEVSNSVKEDRCTAENVSVAEASSSSQATTSAATPPQAQALQESVNQMEIRALQRELATMRLKWNDLERDHGNIQEQVEQISRVSRARSSSWSSGAWKKITKLRLFNNRHHSDSGRTDELRTTNPRRWRNSIS